MHYLERLIRKLHIIIVISMNNSLLRAMTVYGRFILQEQRKNHVFSSSIYSKTAHHNFFSTSSGLENNSISSQLMGRLSNMKIPFFALNSLQLELEPKFLATESYGKQENQVYDIQFAANNGIQDRVVVGTIKTINAQVVSIFDGHGGDKLSEYCATQIIGLIDHYLSENIKSQDQQENEEKWITNSLKFAYSQLQKGFFKEVYEPLVALNNRNIKNVGSCALTLIAFNNKVYVANSGDSQAILVSKNSSGQLSFKQLSERFSVNNKEEREKLIKEFPNDKDIIEQKNGSFYVKGRLQPTRSIGDYYLKQNDLFKGKGKFNGPYIKSEPEVKIFEVSQFDQSIVLGSDGVWDFVDKQKIAELSLLEEPHQQILEQTLRNIADLHSVSVDEIRQIDADQKRSFHDDISIVVMKIGNSMKKLKKQTDNNIH